MNPYKFTHRTHAFTLMETMIALVTLGIMSTAVCILLTGAANTNRYIRSSTDNQSEVDAALHRIMHNLRTAAQITTPNNNIASTTLTLITQPDTGYPSGATITYTLSSGTLTENDPRFGTNTLVHNAATFAITMLNGSTRLFQVDLIAGSPPVQRHTVIFNRN